MRSPIVFAAALLALPFSWWLLARGLSQRGLSQPGLSQPGPAQGSGSA